MTETCQMSQKKSQNSIMFSFLSFYILTTNFITEACPFKKEITRYPTVLGLHGLVFDSGGATGLLL